MSTPDPTIYKAIVDVISQPVMVIDFAGAIICANKAASEFFERDQSELQPLNLSDIVGEDEALRKIPLEKFFSETLVVPNLPVRFVTGTGREPVSSVTLHKFTFGNQTSNYLLLEINDQAELTEAVELAEDCLKAEQVATQHSQELREKNDEIQALNTKIKEQVLVRYLPAEMVEDISAGRIDMDHEPHSQTVTVLFSDLSGFTKLGEQLSPKNYAAQLNDYLTFMNEIIFANMGTVDKFIGDSIMVIFGAPKKMPPFQQAQRAINCAVAMHNGLDALNEKWLERGLPALGQRIGIHQGTAVVGNFGSARRSDYTCIGSSVNLASRIESVCEVGKVYVSESIHKLAPDDTEEVGEFELKGVEGNTSLYKLVEWE